MNMLDTIKDSNLESFFPEGWDLKKIDECCSNLSKNVDQRQGHWNKDFMPVSCDTVSDFDVMMGHEIALTIKKTKEEGRKLALILPVGPMGMYKWAVYFLKEWGVDCKHVYGFNMDEWSDKEGNTLDEKDPASFKNAMQNAFYGPLGAYTVPEEQRNFATLKDLPQYPEKIRKLKEEGAKLTTVFGIGRVFHIAFWEPHFAKEYSCEKEWKAANYRLGGRLHPLTIEQNALTSFKGKMTSVTLLCEYDWARFVFTE